MQSEHMKELLFTIYPLFFNLTTQDATEKGRGVKSANRGASAGGDGQLG